MCKQSLCFVMLLSLAAGSLMAQERKKGAKKKQAPSPEASLPEGQPARFAGVIQARRASVGDRQSDFPSISYSRDGALWLIYIEWNDKDADRVLVRRKAPNGDWGEAIELADGNWDHYSPAIAGRGNSAVAVWAGQSDGNYDLFWSEIGADGKASKPARLTSAPASDFNVRACADAQGNVTIVWQSFRAGNADIYARRLSGSSWGPETRISISPASDWEPAIALDSKGVAWISWDSYAHGNYDVFLRWFDGRNLGPLTAVTTEPSAQFHSTVAVDSRDRVWVAWDDAGINWGKDFSRSSAAEGSRGLHYSRTLGMRVLANGRLHDLNDVNQVFTGRMRRWAELPELIEDGAGAMVLIFRHWTLARPHEIYHFYVTRMSGGVWSEPYQLGASSGQNTQRASPAKRPDGGVSIAYSSDGRSPTNLPQDQMHALHYQVWVADWQRGKAAAEAALMPTQLPQVTSTFAGRRQRQRMSVAGKRYVLMLGDCHRHTDIRGHSGVDGSVLDTYRYAIDAAQLDFLGTADHNEAVGGRWPDGLRDYQWWWTQKAVDLMTHAPHFVGIYSYEHSMSRPAGHRNVLFSKRGAPLRPIDRERRPEDNLPPNLWKWWEQHVLSQPGQKSVIVPHTFAAGPLADWNWPNARFDCLLEMYQGARGSYEAWRLPEKEKRGPTQTDEPGHFAQDALARGNVYGFVSFSDHGSTHNSWAGVWVEKEDRDGILDAMYARRTYAASDEIIVKATAAGHMPGEEFRLAGARGARIEAYIEAMDTILRVDVVKDGKYVYTMRPLQRRTRLSWRDAEVKSGRAYYYLRVFQRDPEAPEGDPEIAWISPFYVDYR